MGVYVDVTDIPDEFLAIMGYILVKENTHYKIYENKGDVFIMPKKGKRLLLVHDINDVPYFKGRKSIPAPPWN